MVRLPSRIFFVFVCLLLSAPAWAQSTGTLTVIKSLSPSDDPGLFNLLIDGSVVVSNVGNGGTTGAVTESVGTHQVSETAAGTTLLTNYTSAISCTNGATSTNSGPLSVNVTTGSIVCTITNTRRHPGVYASTGTGGQVYGIDTTTGATALLLGPTSGADYEGLVVGPNNEPSTAPAHPYLVYVADRAHNQIVRFDANQPPVANGPIETVYDGTASLAQPESLRIIGSDLYITSKTAGSGLWIIKGAANQPFGTHTASFVGPIHNPPDGLLSANSNTQVSTGLAVKNMGDLLIVDSVNADVVRSTFSSGFMATPTIFIPSPSTNSNPLVNPFGVARRSDSQIYVSNQANKPFIEHFDASGNVVTACPSLTFKNNTTLGMMQMSPSDTLFVAGAVSNGGALWSVDASGSSGCLSTASAIRTSISLPPLVGVALDLPNFAASQTSEPAVSNGGSAIANFGYAALQFIDASGSCNLTVTATLTPPAVLSRAIGTIFPAIQAQPAVDLGWDGFETVVNPFNSLPPGCAALSDGLFHYLLAVNVPSTVTNPLSIFCPTSSANCSSTLEAVYPFGGPLPSDITTRGTKSNCTIFTANSTFPPANNEPGTFCLYQPPLSNTSLGQTTATLPSGNQIAVKFKLALASLPTLGNCQSGPYITDAQALLSVVQTTDAMGNPTFVPMTIVVNGIQSPLYQKPNTGNNQQYTAKWDTSQCTLPDGTTEDCPAGTYTLTTVFTSNNTSFPGSTDSIYSTQTTLLQIVRSKTK